MNARDMRKLVDMCCNVECTFQIVRKTMGNELHVTPTRRTGNMCDSASMQSFVDKLRNAGMTRAETMWVGFNDHQLYFWVRLND